MTRFSQHSQLSSQPAHNLNISQLCSNFGWCRQRIWLKIYLRKGQILGGRRLCHDLAWLWPAVAYKNLFKQSSQNAVQSISALLSLMKHRDEGMFDHLVNLVKFYRCLQLFKFLARDRASGSNSLKGYLKVMGSTSTGDGVLH